MRGLRPAPDLRTRPCIASIQQRRCEKNREFHGKASTSPSPTRRRFSFHLQSYLFTHYLVRVRGAKPTSWPEHEMILQNLIVATIRRHWLLLHSPRARTPRKTQFKPVGPPPETGTGSFISAPQHGDRQAGKQAGRHGSERESALSEKCTLDVLGGSRPSANLVLFSKEEAHSVRY